MGTTRAIRAAIALACLAAAAGPARARPSDLPPSAGAVAAASGVATGAFRGSWIGGMTGGKADLDLGADGRGGSLALTNLSTFGDRPAPLADVSAADGEVRFRAVGADGRGMEATLKLAPDGGSLGGHATYHGLTYLLDLRRVAP